MTRLSHSAAGKYELCPAQYKLHYIDRIRSDKLGSALLFGSAIDEALNVLLATKMDTPAENATDDLDRLKKGFDYHMTYQMVGEEFLDVRTLHYIEYFGSDFDPNILTSKELGSLSDYIKNAGYIKDPNDQSSGEPDPIDLYNEIKEYIKDGATIQPTDQSYYNYASWLSLQRKGHLMLEHYKEEIMPKIKRVTSIQREVDLPNEEGDELIGFIDFEGELFDYEDLGVITIDNKTSSSNYRKADINDKGQLLVYDEETENGYGAYIVLLKKVAIRKEKTCKTCGTMTIRAVKKCPEGETPKTRCNGEMEVVEFPYIKSQILVDQIDDDKKSLHFDTLCGILEGIQNKEFAQNRDNCFQFGRKCCYYDYCRSNPNDPDATGLIKKEDK